MIIPKEAHADNRNVKGDSPYTDNGIVEDNPLTVSLRAAEGINQQVINNTPDEVE
ncbi:hypothetical protein NEE14_011920 [Parabacteroides sp. AD58]|uniref:Uncharacterized protein n=1 Tax=Parabacteroides absconsus TaxID=2951805 RepID=A0ABZ2IMC1_9BACT|nr:hypothetical protein [Parabacteroides sp. AD58]MCM6901193.1 hypothetical protein [Parabacteroides sp. AD58]